MIDAETSRQNIMRGTRLLSAPASLVSVFRNFFNEKLYISHKSSYFSIKTHFVVTEYAYLILDKVLVFIFAYMALVKYWPLITMVRHRKYRQMLTGFRRS